MQNGLESIYRAHRTGLLAVALSVTRSASDAEDALHDAFARLCRAEASLGNDAVAYAFKAVRNAAIDRVRARRNGFSAAPLETCLTTGAVDVEGGERTAAILRAVDGLSDELRDAVVLRIFGGLTFRQVAEITGSPLQTIVSRFNMALEHLRPTLKEWL